MEKHLFQFKPTSLMKSSTFSSLAAAMLLVIGAAPSAKAVQIAWGSDFEALLYQADGSTLDAGFTFELGTFNTGFVPTELNMLDWQSNWKLLDRADWDVPNQNFSGFVEINSSGNVSNGTEANPATFFAEGEQIYLWAFNTQTFTPGSTEWALVTRTQPDPFGGTTVFDWVIPTYTQNDAQEVQLNGADIVVFGGLHNVQGPGEYDAGSQPGNFQLQTHVVPEPGSALLLGAIGLLARLRRRRNR